MYTHVSSLTVRGHRGQPHRVGDCSWSQPATWKDGWSKHGSSIIPSTHSIPQDLCSPCLKLTDSARTMFTPSMFSRRRHNQQCRGRFVFCSGSRFWDHTSATYIVWLKRNLIKRDTAFRNSCFNVEVGNRGLAKILRGFLSQRCLPRSCWLVLFNRWSFQHWTTKVHNMYTTK